MFRNYIPKDKILRATMEEQGMHSGRLYENSSNEDKKSGKNRSISLKRKKSRTKSIRSKTSTIPASDL